MQDRIAGIITLGFLSLFMIGAAGAASDSYFEAAALEDTHKVMCSSERLTTEERRFGTPNCSVHRVSTTYGRQLMATSLTRDRGSDD